MPAITVTQSSGSQDIDGLLSGVKWAISTLTYSFPATAGLYGSRYGSGEALNNFDVLNTTQQSVARKALGMYSAVANLTFTEITETPTNHADLRFGQSDEPATAWAYYPATNSYGGDSWYNNSTGWYDNPVHGNYAYHTFIHEIGHALGLKHAHEGAAVSAAHDSMEYTVMSYRSYVGQPLDGGYTNGAWSYAQTPMMYDIAALQTLYGANYSTNSGDTTYAWNPSTAALSINGQTDAPGQNRIFMTVWDGGGTDTYDFSAYTTGVIADLRPGQWSTTSSSQLAYLGDGRYAVGSIANALLFQGSTLSLIENVFGGAGPDTLTGNDAANSLVGNAGADSIYGLAGDDRLAGGPSGDRLEGGSGIDTADYSASASSVTVDLITNNNRRGDAENDLVFDIENVVASSFADTISGNGAANYLEGGNGPDILSGRAGADVLLGGDGNDILVGGASGDALNGGNDVDTADYSSSPEGVNVNLATNVNSGGDAAYDVLLGMENVMGSSVADTIAGDQNDNSISGGAGADSIYGLAGDDRLVGGASGDRLEGGSGIDTADYSASASSVTVDLITNNNRGGNAENDLVFDIESVVASSFADTISGSGVANYIDGGDGPDILSGRAGSDVLLGGDGNDTLIGGADGDSLNGGNGVDTDDYSSSPDGVNVNLATNVNTGGDAAYDVLLSMENVTGSGFADTITGDQRNNVLRGGVGADRLTGGDGRDTFVYGGLPDAGDVVIDFIVGAAGDILYIAELLEALPGYTGADAFSAGYLAYTYSGTNTLVRVDADGGADAFVLLATLNNALLQQSDVANYLI